MRLYQKLITVALVVEIMHVHITNLTFCVSFYVYVSFFVCSCMFLCAPLCVCPCIFLHLCMCALRCFLMYAWALWHCVQKNGYFLSFFFFSHHKGVHRRDTSRMSLAIVRECKEIFALIPDVYVFFCLLFCMKN